MISSFDKTVLRSVTHSLGRFLAIAVIAALGTGFYAGLRMTAPDMKLAGDIYFDGTNMSDLRVMSSLGLDEGTLEAVRSVEGVEGVMPSYETDVLALLNGVQYTVRIHSLDVDAARASDTSNGVRAVSEDVDYINRPILVEGSWPEQEGECVIAADAVTDSDVAVGDAVEVLEGAADIDDTLRTRTYVVTGFVRSSYYASTTSFGTTSLGNGTVEQYMYVPEVSFVEGLPYTEAFVTVAGAKDLDASSAAYDEAVAAVAARLEEAGPAIGATRLETVKADAQRELDEGRAAYEAEKADAEAQLADAEARLADAKARLDEACVQLDNAAASIEEGQRLQDAGQADYEAGVAALARERESAEARFAEGQAAIDAQRPQVEEGLAQLPGLRAQLDQVNAGIAEAEERLAEYGFTLDQIPELQAMVDAALENDPGNALLLQTKQDLALAAQVVAAKPTLEDAIAQIEDGAARLDAAQADLDAGRVQAEEDFAQAQSQLDAAAVQLESGCAQLSAGRADYESGMADYEEGLSSYEEGMAEFEQRRADAEARLADAEAELDDAQHAIDDIAAPTWYVLDRSKNVGAASFESDANRVDQIAAVFPFIFFLVAALVSLTTMTRMVDEERVLIGTYKALGYRNGRIVSKYLIYAVVASGAGSVVGIVALSLFLPYFIMNAYAIVYDVPPRPVPLDPVIACVSAGLGIGITAFATWAAVRSSLRETPAALMLPRAPKAGKRILLEYIRPLWSRLSFSWKVTARNLFRYKRRFFMAVVGIAGCTALLLTGLGLQNAINDIIDKQFGQIYHYNMVVRTDDGIDEEGAQRIEELLEEAAAPFARLRTANMMASAEADASQADQRFELVVPQDPAGIGDFVTMRTRVGRDALALDDSGVVVSEKLAAQLRVSEGDVIVLFDEDDIGNAVGTGYEVRVAGIMENYVSQYAFMAPSVYESLTGEAPVYATYYANASSDEGARAGLSEELLSVEGLKTVGYNDEAIDTYRTMLKSVDSVVVVLVVAAALLAFVVLYNLTNINITERVREIATLKVLGFTPREVDGYIFRETILLSVIGSLAGLVLGVFMEGFVVVTAEVDQVMFGRDIHLESFVMAFALTMVFSVVVAIAMRRKLAKIDMVESLKSNE